MTAVRRRTPAPKRSPPAHSFGTQPRYIGLEAHLNVPPHAPPFVSPSAPSASAASSRRSSAPGLPPARRPPPPRLSFANRFAPPRPRLVGVRKPQWVRDSNACETLGLPPAVGRLAGPMQAAVSTLRAERVALGRACGSVCRAALEGGAHDETRSLGVPPRCFFFGSPLACGGAVRGLRQWRSQPG